MNESPAFVLYTFFFSALALAWFLYSAVTRLNWYVLNKHNCGMYYVELLEAKFKTSLLSTMIKSLNADLLFSKKKSTFILKRSNVNVLNCLISPLSVKVYLTYVFFPSVIVYTFSYNFLEKSFEYFSRWNAGSNMCDFS